jgi:hypothetical protein
MGSFGLTGRRGAGPPRPADCCFSPTMHKPPGSRRVASAPLSLLCSASARTNRPASAARVVALRGRRSCDDVGVTIASVAPGGKRLPRKDRATRPFVVSVVLLFCPVDPDISHIRICPRCCGALVHSVA